MVLDLERSSLADLPHTLSTLVEKQVLKHSGRLVDPSGPYGYPQSLGPGSGSPSQQPEVNSVPQNTVWEYTVFFNIFEKAQNIQFRTQQRTSNTVLYECTR